MKRFGLSLWLLTVAASVAQAAPMSAQVAGNYVTFGNVVLPKDGVLAIEVKGSGVNSFEWRVPNLTAADSGKIYSLTEDNAASYGANWSALETLFKSPYLNFYNSYVSGFPAPQHSMPYADSNFSRYKVNDIERVDFHLWQLYASPIGSIADTTHTLFFDGEIIPAPEPAGWLLACAALCLSVCHRGYIRV